MLKKSLETIISFVKGHAIATTIVTVAVVGAVGGSTYYVMNNGSANTAKPSDERLEQIKQEAEAEAKRMEEERLAKEAEEEAKRLEEERKKAEEEGNTELKPEDDHNGEIDGGDVKEESKPVVKPESKPSTGGSKPNTSKPNTGGSTGTTTKPEQPKPQPEKPKPEQPKPEQPKPETEKPKPSRPDGLQSDLSSKAFNLLKRSDTGDYLDMGSINGVVNNKVTSAGSSESLVKSALENYKVDGVNVFNGVRVNKKSFKGSLTDNDILNAGSTDGVAKHYLNTKVFYNGSTDTYTLFVIAGEVSDEYLMRNN